MAVPSGAREGQARLSRSALVTALVASTFIACKSETDEPRAPGDAPLPEAGAACPIDDTSGAPVSFERDLVPFFSVTCAFGGCHDGDSRSAGLYLGPNFTEGEADAETRRAMHESLLANASTTDDLPRITPFEPSKSFVILKLAGCQNDAGLTCRGAVAGQPCGARMPALSDPLPAESRRMFARWVAEGAARD